MRAFQGYSNFIERRRNQCEVRTTEGGSGDGVHSSAFSSPSPSRFEENYSGKLSARDGNETSEEPPTSRMRGRQDRIAQNDYLENECQGRTRRFGPLHEIDFFIREIRLVTWNLKGKWKKNSGIQSDLYMDQFFYVLTL